MPSNAERAPRHPEGLREWLVLAAAVLVITALSLATALVLRQQRADTLDTWRLYMDNFSTTVAEHAQQVVYTADGVLGRIVERVQEEAGDSEARLREIARSRRMFDFISEQHTDGGLASDIAIIDMQGQVLVNRHRFPAPHVNVYDRDYFKIHLAQPALQSYLSAPVLSRDSGRWTFFLTRKIRSSSGQMLGLVITGIEVSYFERFYRSINLDDAHTAVLLLRRDGTPLARHPQRVAPISASYRDAPALQALEQALAQGRRSANVLTAAPRPSDPRQADRRMVAARAVEAFPLVVVTLATEELMLRGWRESAWFMGLGTAALDAAIAVLALWSFRLLRRRRQAIGELAEANRVKAEFLAGISREIRAPLHDLVEMARRLHAATPALPPAQQRRELRAFMRSGTLLLGLVDDLLDFSRLETGRLELEHAPFVLAPLAQKCIALFESPAQAKGVRMELYMGVAAHGEPVLGDARRLAQIINNLLSNALRHTDAGCVSLSLAPLGAGRWRVAVADTGSGMTAEQRRRLFEPLSMAASPAPLGDGGIGLGLSIVKRLVLLHGGTVGVRSEPGQGTEIWCELPLPPASSAQTPGPQAPAPEGADPDRAALVPAQPPGSSTGSVNNAS
ncbi:ATP-binding protein [uncultured Azohydromonas sp.]|uniref:sensor histidine kinase n=1 Tax=uncultured Azohydromonas sp. TaxID=487342 RepID=UPI002623B902|nr:ATP-binding protein [uncultured Azohydromonas sp.]